MSETGIATDQDETPFAEGLGALLIARGKTNAAGLERAARLAETSGEPLHGVLTKLGLVTERDMAEALAEHLGLPLASPDEARVLASIVEKETALADERRHVAGVFINRLNRGMRLQSDATVIYAIAGPDGTMDRPLTRADLDVDSPYNTYRVTGLPPTPIANPGRAALTAVLDPLPTKDIYFVADGAGGHAFAATLAEHNRNVAKWRKIQRARKQQTE